MPVEQMERKWAVLARIAEAFNREGLVWAVGGSLLLHLKGKTDRFADLDLMVGEGDVERAAALLAEMGRRTPTAPNPAYRTRHFLEWQIDGVDVDVMAGFVIVKDGVEHECPLLPERIAEWVTVQGQRIPLQSLDDWRRYYRLMGREEKVRMIDAPAPDQSE